MIKEACVESFEQGLNAESQGADRIELCADLANDGLTPAKEVISKAADNLSIPIRVMIRPRAGDFVYTQDELLTMRSSIDFCKSVNVEGVVFGICKPGNTLDLAAISALADYAKPLKVVVHKAIDACENPLAELQGLKKIKNVDSVLTSGKAETAFEGFTMLHSLIAAAGDEIEIVACGKITNENLPQIKNRLNARAYHGKLIVGQI